MPDPKDKMTNDDDQVDAGQRLKPARETATRTVGQTAADEEAARNARNPPEGQRDQDPEPFNGGEKTYNDADQTMDAGTRNSTNRDTGGSG